MATLQDQLKLGEPMEDPIANAAARELYGPEASVVRLPKYTLLDRAVIKDGEVVAFMEIKTRAAKSEEYPSTVVAEVKHKAARAIRNTIKVPTALVVMFEDTIGCWRLFEKPARIAELTDRARDETRPHCFYDNARMRRLDIAYREVVASVGLAPIVKQH